MHPSSLRHQYNSLLQQRQHTICHKSGPTYHPISHIFSMVTRIQVFSRHPSQCMATNSNLRINGSSLLLTTHNKTPIFYITNLRRLDTPVETSHLKLDLAGKIPQ